jgi:hypothetical protein
MAYNVRRNARRYLHTLISRPQLPQTTLGLGHPLEHEQNGVLALLGDAWPLPFSSAYFLSCSRNVTACSTVHVCPVIMLNQT